MTMKSKYDPVFLVAARRSGTTLFRLMMNGHPKVRWYRGWEPVADAVSILSPAESVRQELDVVGLGPVSAKSLQELKTQIDLNLTEILASERCQVIGATVHVGFLSLPKAWPNARFIHLVRDPRDIAISNMKLGWAGHPFEAAASWATAEQDWDRIRQSLQAAQYIEIRYEDLVSRPRNELDKVCDFLGIPFDNGMFSYTETSNYSYPKPELAQRWRRSLGEKEIRFIEYGLHELMLHRGYLPQSSEITMPAILASFYRSIGKWNTRRLSLKENGLRYLLLRKIANKSKSKKLLQRVEDIETAKRAQHIKNLEKSY